MATGVWRKIPDEIVLHITAKLLPRRSLVRLRALWKAWNEMMSSYAAMQRIYPNISLYHSTAFLFQFDCTDIGKIHSWVMEGSSGEYYKAGVNSYWIEIACNTMFCLRHCREFYLCEEENRSLTDIADTSDHMFFGQAFDSSTNQFIMVMGTIPFDQIEVYDSASNAWCRRMTTYSGEEYFFIKGRGVYHKGKFYWLIFEYCEGMVFELNLEDYRWTSVRLPSDADYEHFVNRTSSHDYYLGGSHLGQVILVERRSGSMWKLENAEEILNFERWSRIDIRLPENISAIAVNNNGWVMAVVADEINIYDGNLGLVRKVAIEGTHPEFGIQIKEIMKKNDYSLILHPPLLPFECSYVWWPGNRDL